MLHFVVQPEFVSPRSVSIVAQKNERVTMRCEVHEYVYPLAIVTWLKGGGLSYKNVSTGPRFTIESVKLDDGGLYVCQARNYPDQQPATKLISLTVYGMMTESRKHSTVITLISQNHCLAQCPPNGSMLLRDVIFLCKFSYKAVHSLPNHLSLL